MSRSPHTLEGRVCDDARIRRRSSKSDVGALLVAELTGLAPAFISCSELDPLRDEAVDYALRLLWAGVATELHAFPGTCHGFDSLLPDWSPCVKM